MSCPAFAWALERGATLALTPADRLVLIYLADMANGDRVCWPGQQKIVEFTGLALRTVRTSLQRLEKIQLIRAEARDGYVTRYHILRADTPANGIRVTPANQHPVTPANGNPLPRQMVPTHPGKQDAEPRQMVPRTPANGNPDPYFTQVSDPRARARAQEGKVLDSGKEGKQAATPPPAPPPKAPVLGTTDGSAPAHAIKPPDPFGDWLAEGTPASHPGRPVPLATPEPEIITEDDPPRTEADRARMAAQFAQLAHEISQSKRHFAIQPVSQTGSYLQGPRFTRDVQRDLAAKMSRPDPPSVGPEILAAMYRAQGVRRGATAGA